MTKKIRSTLRAPEALIESLKAIAQHRGCTLNGLIREILWDWINDNSQKAEEIAPIK